MRLHILQHTASGRPGTIDTWAHDKNIPYTKTRFYLKDTLPSPESVDFVIILGGPMSANDDMVYPWIQDEILFIQEIINAGKSVLGICLGAQLIARALGGTVKKNHVMESGWFRVYHTQEATTHPHAISTLFPESFFAFQWHEDTFTLPEKTFHLLSSTYCTNQAFTYGEHVLGLQFHIEMTPEIAAIIMHKNIDREKYSPSIQSPSEMLKYRHCYDELKKIHYHILDYFLARFLAKKECA